MPSGAHCSRYSQRRQSRCAIQLEITTGDNSDNIFTQSWKLAVPQLCSTKHPTEIYHKDQSSLHGLWFYSTWQCSHVQLLRLLYIAANAGQRALGLSTAALQELTDDPECQEIAPHQDACNSYSRTQCQSCFQIRMSATASV